MYLGNNPSALRSKKIILEAFLNLLQTQPFSKLTVKQIMIETDLSRQTFYQIFSSKDEILECVIDNLFDEFMSNAEHVTINDLCDTAKLLFTFFNQNKQILKLYIDNGKSSTLQSKCSAFLIENEYINYELTGVHNEMEKDYATTFVISGILSLLEKWLEEEDETAQESGISADEIAHLICRITGVALEQ